MEENILKYINELLFRYPKLKSCKDDIIKAFEILRETFFGGNKLLVCGNGGSAADSEHIVGELMKDFKFQRNINLEQMERMKAINLEMGTVLSENLQQALPAIALTSQSALSTAISNDRNPELMFAQQVNGYGKKGDCFLGISTSGNSSNVVYAAVTAKARDVRVIGLTGLNHSKLMDYSDVCIRVPEEETYKIQELHLPIYHCLCLMLEDFFFKNEN